MVFLPLILKPAMKNETRYLRVAAFAVVLLMAFEAQSQKSAPLGKHLDLGEYAPWSVSYFGELIAHPGFRISTDLALFQLNKTTPKKKRTKYVRKLLTLSPNIAFYNHADSHSALIPAAELSWRRYSKSLFYFEKAVGLGAMMRFNAGDTWQVASDGKAERIGTTSRTYFAPSISLGAGKHIPGESVSTAIFLKANTNFVTGYAGGSIVEYSAELGARFYFQGGVKVKAHEVKSKEKE